jgi:putative methanogenesis marker protein 8
MREHKRAKHVIEVAKARVVIEDGIIKKIGRPRTEYCPLFEDLYNAKHITRQLIRSILEHKIENLGMYTERRKLDHDDVVPFGTSEIVKTAMKKGLLDSAVLVCEGAGTVITNDPNLVQGIGARLTGILYTTPIPTIIEKLKTRGAIVLDPANATIDQIKGLTKAAELGFKKVAVMLAGHDAQKATELRKLEKKLGIEVWIFVLHTTGIKVSEARRLIETADVVWACASKVVREVIGPKALVQIGTAIPVFAVSERGKMAILARAETIKEPLALVRIKPPMLAAERQPRPLT